MLEMQIIPIIWNSLYSSSSSMETVLSKCSIKVCFITSVASMYTSTTHYDICRSVPSHPNLCTIPANATSSC